MIPARGHIRRNHRLATASQACSLEPQEKSLAEYDVVDLVATGQIADLTVEQVLGRSLSARALALDRGERLLRVPDQLMAVNRACDGPEKHEQAAQDPEHHGIASPVSTASGRPIEALVAHKGGGHDPNSYPR